MESALFVSKISNLKYFNSDYSRLYFGNEFCQNLLPSIEDLRYALNFASKRGIPFTLVTPFVTDQYLPTIEGLIHEIDRLKPQSEVVFNDFGVFHMLNRLDCQLLPVMGRLLCRMKRGPRLMTIINKLPQTTIDYFRKSNLTVPILFEFLKDSGVTRVELDNVLQGIDFKVKILAASLYYPFAYVTTTRFCLVNSCDKPDRAEMIGIFPCKKECQNYTFFLRNEIMPVELIRKGNTIFFRNEILPEDLDKMGIDRIIVQPEIPM